MRKRVQKKIHELREQPDHVRIRAASYFTIVSGAVLVVLWLFVFLPVQLYVGSRGNESTEQTAQSEATPSVAQDTPVPQVGGVRQNSQEDVPLFVTPEPTASSTPNTLPIE